MPAAPISVQPVAPYPHAAYRKLLFCCQTSKAGCTSRRKPAVPGSPLPVLCRSGLPVLLLQLHWVEALGLLPKPGILVQSSSSSAEYFCSRSSNRFRLCSMAAMSLGELFGSIFLGICQRRQKPQILLRTQFLQILCQRAILAASSRCWNTWTAESAFFSESRLRALFRLIPNVLCQLIVLCEGGAQRIQRSVQAFLALAGDTPS